MDQIEKTLSDMMQKSKIDNAMTIEFDQDLSADKAEFVKPEPKIEKKPEPVSEAVMLLLEFFKKETRDNGFYDHMELDHRKKVQKFLIEKEVLEPHECARR